MFLGGVVGLVFFGGFLPMFLLYFLGSSLPKVFGKILLMSGLVFFGFVLSSGFFVDVVFRVFFSREIVQVVTGHPLTRTCFAVPFLFLCPAVFVCFARFGRASCFSAFFSGCHSGPRAFLGFSLNLWGLSLFARPFRGPFLGTRGSKGFLVFLLSCFLFPLVFCGPAFSRKPGVISLTRGTFTHPSEE